MLYPAHIKFSPSNEKIVQTVAEHNKNTAAIASELIVAKLATTARLAGLLHDMGKYTSLFAEYIEKAARGEKVDRGSVNHTFAGVRFAFEQWHNGRSQQSVVCELLAFAAGSHHGMFDCIGENGADGYAHRLEKEGIGYEQANSAFLSDIPLEELEAMFAKAKTEVFDVISQFSKFCGKQSEVLFSLSMLARMLLSVVIDADRRDTAEFMHGAATQNKTADKELWRSCLEKVERRLSKLPCEKEIDKARSEFSNQCRAAAGFGSGVYRLSVPTGGGKTLASLRFALAAAMEHEKKRVVLVTPLLSVLEQNSAVIRDFIDDDSLILEHHSNVIREKSETDELDINELLVETWDAPIIITTLVQLLNTLFSGKTSCIRRMNALAQSVIIIDEVQSVPKNMLSLFNMAMNFLAEVCGCTIVLCSATHPCLETVKHPLRFGKPEDIVPHNPALWQVFGRTKIIDKRIPGGYSVDELAAFAAESAGREGSLLLICNKKAAAVALYRALSAQTGARVFHLSTSMCVQHRIDTLNAINAALKAKEQIICVSTQLVEAGVDFSFGCVIRISAGIDNVIQAAGRCNRGGEYGRLCPVYIVNLKGEKLDRLKEIKQAQYAAESVLESFRQNSADFSDDLSSLQSINAYYKRLYLETPHNAQDFPQPKLNTTIFELLSDNQSFWAHCERKDKYTLTGAFRTAGDSFKVFDDNTIDLLVPYGKGFELQSDLQSSRAGHDYAYCKEKLEEAKRFTISLYEYELKALERAGGAASVWNGDILMVNPGFYSPDIGFDLATNNLDFWST